MDYGQWFGSIDGGAKGPIFVNIDQSQQFKRGSIIVDDKTPNSLPFIAYLTILENNTNQIKARVHDFIFYQNDVPINSAVATMVGSVLSSYGDVYKIAEKTNNPYFRH